MSLIVKAHRQPFIPAPEGSHIARCYRLVDLGRQTVTNFHTEENKVLIGWELDKKMPNGQPFVHHQAYTARTDDKTHLRALLEGWLGRSLTDTEKSEGYPLLQLLGQGCYLTLKHSRNPQNLNEVWVQATAAAPLPAGAVCPPPVNPTLVFDVDHYTEAEYQALPETLRKKINLKRQLATNPLTPAAPTTAVDTLEEATFSIGE